MKHLSFPRYPRRALERIGRIAAGIYVGIHLVMASGATEHPIKSFDVPHGNAIDTLKQAAQQGGVEIMFLAETVRGVKTNSIKGAFEPRDALDWMLNGTPLRCLEDKKTGALAVVRIAPPGPSPPDKAQTVSPKTNKDSAMKAYKQSHKSPLAWLAAVILSLGSSNLQAQSAQSNTSATAGDESSQDREQPIVLNPFDVNASSNAGYGAATTASSSRMQQAYIDVPQTVDVVTSEFMEDLNTVDIRQALMYTPNVEFGGGTNIRGAAVNLTYVDGVALPPNGYGSAIGMPLDFFDRIEVVKGPSSVAFGLGEPGGLLNFVSKVPNGTDATSASVGVGGNANYLARFDTQGVDKNNDKLSYRLVGFYDTGGYELPNIFHNGAGAQLSFKYDLNPTTTFDLIVAYSSTVVPVPGIYNTAWENYTSNHIYEIENLGSSNYTYLPGTKFTNGAIYGVSGQLPPPGTQTGIEGTGDLASVGSNSTPQGFDGDNEGTLRTTLLFNKTFADGHWHLRNALTFVFDQSDVYMDGPTGVLSKPGSANTPPPQGVGNASYGEPNGVDTFVGPPVFDILYYRDHVKGNSTARDDELDFLGTYHFLGGDWQTLLGTDFYDNESYFYGYQVQSIDNPDGALADYNLYSNNNPPEYVSPNNIPNESLSQHSWGDGFYAQEDASLLNDKLDLLAGWRIDYFDTETRNYLSNTNTFPGWVNTKGAPRYAVTIKPTKWLSFYELYTVHKDPTESTNRYYLAAGNEYTPALQAQFPESELTFYQPGGTTIESGMKASLFDGKIYGSVAVFHELITGEVVGFVAANVINSDGSNTQIGEHIVEGLNAHGVEAQLFGQPTPHLSFTASFAFFLGEYPALAPTATSGPTNPYPLDPPTTVSWQGKYDFGNPRRAGFYFTFGGEWFSPYEALPAGSRRLPNSDSVWWTSSQYLLNGGIGYHWQNGRYRSSLFFNMNNIENSFVADGGFSVFETEPFREWTLTYKISY